MPNNIALIAIGIYFTLLGILSVTSVSVEMSDPIMGWSALVAGIICLFVGISNVVNKRNPPS